MRRGRLPGAFLAVLAVACDGGQPTIVLSDPPRARNDDAGWAALTDWDRIPELGPGTYRQFSSHDRNPSSAFPLTAPGNKDFNNFLTVCGARPSVIMQELDGTTCDVDH